MGQTILITESQYSRIFLSEQYPPKEYPDIGEIDITQGLKSWKSKSPIGKVYADRPSEWIDPMYNIQSDRLGSNSDFDYRMKSINNAI